MGMGSVAKYRGKTKVVAPSAAGCVAYLPGPGLLAEASLRRSETSARGAPVGA